MLNRFRRFIESHAPGVTEGLSLLAISGGADSVAMGWLYHLSAFPFAVVHVNYGLRDRDSDADEEFVRSLALRWNVPFFSIRPATRAEADAHGESVQMAARRLRYAFFRKTMAETGASFICTAHHLDDNLEHLFIYLMRNSPAAFRGIDVYRDPYFRPLMFTGREEIRDWLSSSGYAWREDSSNDSVDYLRNKVRHWLMPQINEHYPEAAGDFAEISADVADLYRKCRIRQSEWAAAHGEESGSGRLFRWDDPAGLRSYLRFSGMHQSQISRLMKPAQPGSAFYFQGSVAEVQHSGVWVGPAGTPATETAVIQEAGELPVCVANSLFEISITLEEDGELQQIAAGAVSDCWYFDAGDLIFPLMLRPRGRGDRLQPFGMSGTKKVSDILTDAHIPNRLKEEYPVLCDQRQLLGVIGLRRSSAAPVKAASKKMVCVRWNRISGQIEV